MTTSLRLRMLQDLQRASHSERSQQAYFRPVRQLDKHFRTRKDRPGEQHVRDHQ